MCVIEIFFNCSGIFLLLSKRMWKIHCYYQWQNTSMADLLIHLSLVILLTCLKEYYCVQPMHLFTATRSVFQNFTNTKTITVDSMNVCILKCNAFESCYGVNYLSKECILGFTDPNNSNVVCDSFIKRREWKHAAKGQVSGNFVSISVFFFFVFVG